MAIASPPTPAYRTVADLLARLGDLPPGRIWLNPPPGTATERDVIEAHDRWNRLCELVDGVLVEKAMGYLESMLAIEIAFLLKAYLRQHDLGVVTGADGTVRLAPGLVRIPDVAFVSWDRLPGRKVPREPIPDLASDLAVEVLSSSNTRAEMRRKVDEYFQAGARLVWLIDPPTRTARAFTAPDQSTTLGEDQMLDAGEVVPGFTLPLRQLFESLDDASRPGQP